MTRLVLVFALFAGAMTANASVTYAFDFDSSAFGTTDWQFTVPDFLSASGTTFIVNFDSSSSSFQGTITDVEITDPFSSTPFIQTNGTGGGLSSSGWVGPFDHDAVYTVSNAINTATLTISGASDVPEPSSGALIGVGGCLFALASRRRLFHAITKPRPQEARTQYRPPTCCA